MKEFNEKVAVVTGADSGIGRGIVNAFATSGADVVLAGLAAPRLEAAADEVRCDHGVRAEAVVADVRDAEAVEALADAAYDAFGAVHVVCNNAGVASMLASTWEQPLADWRDVLAVNLYGVVHGVRAFVPRMLAGGEEGHVVNVSSMGGVTPTPQVASYCASKHAVVGLSRTLREEFAATGAPIGVTVVCPGGVRSQIMASAAKRHDGSPLAPAAQRVLDRLAATVEAGITGDEAGTVIRDAVRTKRFYAFPNGAAYFGLVEDEHAQMEAALAAEARPSWQL